MPQPLSYNTIQQLIVSANSDEISSVYNTLYSLGYSYTGWANGVVQEDTIAGVSAQAFLNGTALMGIGSLACQSLSAQTINNIEQGMAIAYLNVLSNQAYANGGITGSTNQDINAQDVWTIHTQVFQDNNLSIDNWTLNTPFTLIQQTLGSLALENFWEALRNTGGTGLDGTIDNSAVLVLMIGFSQNNNPNISAQAQNWLASLYGSLSMIGLNSILNTLSWLGSVTGIPATSQALLNTVQGLLNDLGSATSALFNFNEWKNHINELVNTFFTAATQAVRIDPLVFELNGSSLESTGLSTANPVYFDFSGNGVQTDTGWIGPDNAFLVNLPSGATTVTNGTELVNSFAALSALANGSSVINSSNPAFANLYLWVNSNGTPGSGQLVTLASLGITGINVASTAANQTLSNGNQVAALGSFNYANSMTGTIAAVDLLQNTFNSQFTTPLNTSAFQNQFSTTLSTSSVTGLPDIQGSGQVRSLLEAATLSPTLVTLLQTYQTTTSYSARLALIPAILQAWSATSTMATTFSGAYAGDNLTVNIYSGDNHADGLQAVGSTLYNSIANELTILERFNGTTFNTVPTGTGASATVNIWYTSTDLLQSSYNALQQSVFASLELQTALQPYLNAISLTTTATGMSLNFSGLDALLASNQVANPAGALSDLIELNQYAGPNLYANGWDGITLLQSWAQQAVSSGNTQLQAVLSSMNVELGSNLYTAGAANSILLGQGATETLAGGGGNDILIAGGGNDALNGGIGNNTYVFGIGSGQDTIVTGADATAGKLNTLQLTAGVTESNVVLTQVYDSTYGGNHALQISIAGNTADSITINGFFLNDDPGNANNGVQQISFTDGATWNLATIESMLFGAGSNYAPLIAAQVVAGLTASQVAGLNSQVTYLTAADMAALSAAQLAALSGLDAAYLNSAQVAALGTAGSRLPQCREKRPSSLTRRRDRYRLESIPVPVASGFTKNTM